MQKITEIKSDRKLPSAHSINSVGGIARAISRLILKTIEMAAEIARSTRIYGNGQPVCAHVLLPAAATTTA